jgi:hypothetical protein
MEAPHQKRVLGEKGSRRGPSERVVPQDLTGFGNLSGLYRSTKRFRGPKFFATG